MNSGVEQAKKAIDSIGAVQTLVENFPMKIFSLGDLKFATSFDLLILILKMIGVNKQELINRLTKLLTSDSNEEDSGFITAAEEIVKTALETNIINILNCSTNPIINNDLLDSFDLLGYKKESGEGISVDVSEIDFTGVLNKSPLSENGRKFYFDVEDKNINDLYKSKDFNAFLWYIINKSDKRFPQKNTWDDRYKAGIYKKGQENRGEKEIIKCTYVDEDYPNMDKIKIHLCSSTYYKTRGLKTKKNGKIFKLNKTIFEFNHDFLSSIKLYDSKVIVAEIIEYFFGSALSVNLGFSINDEIIKQKVDGIINNVIKNDDKEINDCYYTFSNEEYNNMLENAEKNRFNIINYGDTNKEIDTSTLLEQLDGINSTSTLHKNQTIISNVLNDITTTPGQNEQSQLSFNLQYDYQFELMRMLVYPFIRPLFTPKVIFLLLVNKKIMGSLEDIENIGLDKLIESLMNSLFFIIKDIIIKLKDMLLEMFLNWVLEELTPLLALFASKLLLETLNVYLSLLKQLLDCFIGFDINNTLKNNGIDNVNYADIINTQIQPNQSLC